MPQKHIKKQSTKIFASRRERLILLLIGVGVFVGIGVLVVWLANASIEPTKTYIAKVTDLGNLTYSTPNSPRDGGDSAIIGGRVVWNFGDTFYVPKVTKFTGDLFRSATAALGTTTNPTQLTEPIDTNGAPYQLIPYTPEELAYNIAKTNGSDRYAIWPSGIVTRPGGNSAYVFFFTLLIQPGNWQNKGVGVATLDANSTVAQRQVNVLFPPNEPSFRKPLVVGNILYLYAACGAKVCPVARVPIDQVPVRSAYRFWNGTDWVADVAQAKPILPSTSLGGTVMYNRTLKSYVLATIQDYSHAIYFSYAPAPEGPWTTPIKAIDLPADKQEYVPNFHPEFSTDNDVSVYISYSTGGKGGGIKLLKVTLNPPVEPIPVSPVSTQPVNPTSSQGSASTTTSTNTNKASSTRTNGNTTQSTSNNNVTTPSLAGSATDKMQAPTTPSGSTMNNNSSQSNKSWWDQIVDYFLGLFSGNN